MNILFLKILNMSIAASWLILAVLIVRVLLKKAPKWMHAMLWGIVGVRLLCPFSMESALSLIPSKQTISKRILYGPSFDIQTGITPIDHRVNEYLGDHYFEGVSVSAGHGKQAIHIWAIVWVIGVAILFFYAAVSCRRIHRQLRMAVLLRDNIFQSEYVTSPFIFGVINPKIYIPFSLNGQNTKYVLAHEQAHIQRKDHWWKLLGFLLLSVHWFNPLVWLSYKLLCRDLELACDEKVIRDLENGQRADYSKALLECSIDYRKRNAFLLTFGEIDVKKRIKNILNYKKAAPGIVIVAVAVCIIISACFLTNPTSAVDKELMTPAVADIKGVFDSYLYVPLQGHTYRYESMEYGNDADSFTKDKRIYQFTEEADPQNVNWQVFSLIEYPDYSVVLAIAGKDYKSLYRYSPSKRSDPDALQQAEKDGCVIMQDGDVALGQQTWQDFVKAAEEGKHVSVKLAHYYTLDPKTCSEQYYEAYKEDYPVLYRYDLLYDGNGYILRWKEGNSEYVRSYPYLLCDTGDKLSLYADYDSYIQYILTNDNTVTWEEIWKSTISSQLGDSIDYFTVYTDLIV